MWMMSTKSASPLQSFVEQVQTPTTLPQGSDQDSLVNPALLCGSLEHWLGGIKPCHPGHLEQSKDDQDDDDDDDDEEECSDCKERFRTSTASQDQLEAYFKQYGGAEPGWP